MKSAEYHSVTESRLFDNWYLLEYFEHGIRVGYNYIKNPNDQKQINKAIQQIIEWFPEHYQVAPHKPTKKTKKKDKKKQSKRSK